MDPTLIFITGLTTGGVSCLAMQMGFLTTALANQTKYRQLGLSAFLLAKLLGYTLLGLILGLVGAKTGMGLNTQLVLQGLAVVFMWLTAANLLELHPIFRYAVIQPPKFAGKWLRRTAKTESLFTPVILGLLTVLVPCGVTQAMMIVALSAGEARIGASTMFFFVLGTIPLFWLVGMGSTFLAEKNTLLFNRIAAGLLFILGMYNVNGILRVLDSPLSFQNMIYVIDNYAQSLAVVKPGVKGSVTDNYVVEKDGVQKVTVEIQANGYKPNEFSVKAGIPVELTLVTNEVYSCASAFTFKKYQIFKQLKPTDQQTITFTPTEKGTFQFSCSMGMYGGIMRVI